jgi:hypothetical protein
VTVDQLITRARKEGIVFRIDGDRVRCQLSRPANFRTRPLIDDIRQRRDEVLEALKLDAHRDFPGPNDAKTLSCDVDAGEIVAVEIASEVLGANIWLAFRDDFNPQDGLAIFYAHELPMLKTKTPPDLREIHKVKLAFGAGSRMRQ